MMKPKLFQKVFYVTGLLDENAKRELQRNSDQLISNLRTDELIIKLFSARLITVAEKAHLAQIPLERKKAEYLIDEVLMKGTYEHLEEFKETLHSTCQSHLVNLIP